MTYSCLMKRLSQCLEMEIRLRSDPVEIVTRLKMLLKGITAVCEYFLLKEENG